MLGLHLCCVRESKFALGLGSRCGCVVCGSVGSVECWRCGGCMVWLVSHGGVVRFVSRLFVSFVTFVSRLIERFVSLVRECGSSVHNVSRVGRSRRAAWLVCCGGMGWLVSWRGAARLISRLFVWLVSWADWCARERGSSVHNGSRVGYVP